MILRSRFRHWNSRLCVEEETSRKARARTSFGLPSRLCVFSWTFLILKTVGVPSVSLDPPERLGTVASARFSQRLLEERTEKVSELDRRLALSEAECERLQQVRARVNVSVSRQPSFEIHTAWLTKM